MRRLFLAGFILGCIAEGAFFWVLFARTTVSADTDLTALVEAAYRPRTEDLDLHALAHERAAFQVAYSGGVCTDGSLTHDGLVTAEVLACNYAGPERAVEQWQGSPVHDAILSDPSLATIGCGSASGLDGATFYACVLGQVESPPASSGDGPRASSVPSSGAAPVGGPAPTPVLLPNTRMP